MSGVGHQTASSLTPTRHSSCGSARDSSSASSPWSRFHSKTAASPYRTLSRLVVHIDSELTFATHVKRVAARCFYQLRQLWSIRPALSADNARMLVHALITSRVDYCNSILCNAAASHLRPFQSVLNTAARLVLKKRKYDSITSTLRDDLHWLLVRQRIDYKLCLFVFKCLHQLAPPYLPSMTVPLLAASTRRNLRSAGQGDLLVSRTKTVSIGPRSFAVAGPSTWNSLPTALKDQ